MAPACGKRHRSKDCQPNRRQALLTSPCGKENRPPELVKGPLYQQVERAFAQDIGKHLVPWILEDSGCLLTSQLHLSQRPAWNCASPLPSPPPCPITFTFPTIHSESSQCQRATKRRSGQSKSLAVGKGNAKTERDQQPRPRGRCCP